jgi:hypothetical protein
MSTAADEEVLMISFGVRCCTTTGDGGLMISVDPGSSITDEGFTNVSESKVVEQGVLLVLFKLVFVDDVVVVVVVVEKLLSINVANLLGGRGCCLVMAVGVEGVTTFGFG